MKIKTLKEFIKYIKKSKLTAYEESIVRMKFILEENILIENILQEFIYHLLLKKRIKFSWI